MLFSRTGSIKTIHPGIFAGWVPSPPIAVFFLAYYEVTWSISAKHTPGKFYRKETDKRLWNHCLFSFTLRKKWMVCCLVTVAHWNQLLPGVAGLPLVLVGCPWKLCHNKVKCDNNRSYIWIYLYSFVFIGLWFKTSSNKINKTANKHFSSDRVFKRPLTVKDESVRSIEICLNCPWTFPLEKYQLRCWWNLLKCKRTISCTSVSDICRLAQFRNIKLFFVESKTI